MLFRLNFIFILLSLHVILRRKVEFQVKKIKTLVTRDLAKSAVTGGCGECQTSCQSASKTSCSVANQKCEQCK